MIVEEAGVRPRCSTACASRRSSRTAAIRGVITESKSGREAILAQRVVDATGDADVAARAGAPTTEDAARGDARGVGHVLDDRGQQARSSRRSRPIRRPIATGPATREWDIETTGKEDELFSPFLRKPFKQAVEAGLIPPNLITLAGTWGTVTDQGDLTYLNLVHLTGIDGTDADDLTRGEIEGRQPGDPRGRRRCARSCPAARTRSCATSG